MYCDRSSALLNCGPAKKPPGWNIPLKPPSFVVPYCTPLVYVLGSVKPPGVTPAIPVAPCIALPKRSLTVPLPTFVFCAAAFLLPSPPPENKAFRAIFPPIPAAMPGSPPVSPPKTADITRPSLYFLVSLFGTRNCPLPLLLSTTIFLYASLGFEPTIDRPPPV